MTDVLATIDHKRRIEPLALEDRKQYKVGYPSGYGEQGFDAGLTTVIFESSREVQGLTEDDAARMSAIGEHKIAASTRKNYVSQWKKFISWAGDRKVSALPAAPELVAAYLAERSNKDGHKPSTLRMTSAAIKFFHLEAELDNPCDSKDVREILSGATRMKGSAQKQAEGITEIEFSAIRQTAFIPRRGRGGNMESKATARHRGEMDIAILGLMRDALLRVSEAADLMWSDVRQVDDGTGRLLIRRSKTDQEGRGAVAFISAQTMESLERIRGNASEADSVFGLACNQLSRRIKRAAIEAGLGEGFSGHSPRVGMAQDLARAGIELPRLMTAGRWRSPRMPALYTRNESVGKGGVAEFYGYYVRYSGNRPRTGAVESGFNLNDSDKIVSVHKDSDRAAAPIGAKTAIFHPIDLWVDRLPRFLHVPMTPDIKDYLSLILSV